MRTLVTGQHGFTGRYVCAALRTAGHDVPPFNADITNRAEIEAAVADIRPEGVVHLAASAFVHSADIARFYVVNQLGTFELLDALTRLTPNIPVLLASSANIYGNTVSGYLDENAPGAPANHYAASKLAMETGAKLWSDRLGITITRPFNYTGRGQHEDYLIAKIVAHFRRREPVIELGNLDVARDFGDVRAVSEAYVKLLNLARPGTYNICTGQVHSLRDVIETCRDITGHNIEIRVNPAFVRANDVALLAGNPMRLRTALGHWNPPPLRDTLQWMLADETGTDVNDALSEVRN